MTIFDGCYKRVQGWVGSVFERYGKLVGEKPLPFIILPILIFGGLGLGLVALEADTDLENLYFPKDSRAIKERQIIRDTFPDLRSQSYNAFSQSDTEEAVVLLFKTKQGQSIFDASVTAEISTIVAGVEALTSSGKTFSTLCAMSSSQCVVDGVFALESSFKSAVARNTVTYPTWNNRDLEASISGETVSAGKLVSATVLKVTSSRKTLSKPVKVQSGSLLYEEGVLMVLFF